ncbi:MAG: tetratricopeptide repeat protein [Bacteroidetes bacterium]|nr:tetratricopeptide repeat protein [Bacteroidota bacterium]
MIINKISTLVLLLSLVMYGVVFGQTGIDTLTLAKNLREKGEINPAMKLLSSYHQDHPGNADAIWIYAQTAYWGQQFHLSKRLYEEAIEKFPGNKFLLLDYGMMLVEIGDFNKANIIIRKFLTYYPVNTEATITLAKIAYWTGNYKMAMDTLHSILIREPDNQGVMDLLKNVEAEKAPWIGINTSFSSDDQPLKTVKPEIDWGMPVSSLISPEIHFQYPLYTYNGSTNSRQMLRATNRSYFRPISLEVRLGAGLFNDPVISATTFLWDVALNKKLGREFLLSAEMDHRPYLSTLSSLESRVTENHGGISLGWNHQGRWTGKIVFETNSYSTDNNSVSSVGAWILTPPLTGGILEVRLGYSFNYSSSKESRFNAALPLSEILADPTKYTNINGIYNPYFTPENQVIHSILGTFLLHPAKNIRIGGSGSYGFLATTSLPFLYLSTTAYNDTVIERGFMDKTFSPIEVKMYLEWQLSGSVSLKGEYLFSKTLYYTSNYLIIGIKKRW